MNGPAPTPADLASMTAATYGDDFADVYDDWYGDVSDVDATVAAVARLGAGRPVLELGVGTGRLAVPLARTGVAVDGLDASAAMLDRLRRNDPTGSVRPLLGDMAAPLDAVPDDRRSRGYGAVFVAFNTFSNLWRSDDQASCLRGVAEMLHPAGAFACELFVPAAGIGPNGVSSDERTDGHGGRVVRHSLVAADGTVWGVLEHHPAAGPTVRRRWAIRPVSPSELDALADAAGMTLVSRTATWGGETFHDGDSTHHVSIYRPV